MSELANAVLALNTGWNDLEPEHLIAERIDLCRRLALAALAATNAAPQWGSHVATSGIAEAAPTPGTDLASRLRELDVKGYQPMTGPIGDKAANRIENLERERDHAIQVCRQLEQELAEARERLTDTQHRNGKNIVRAENAEAELADLKIKMSGNSRDYEVLLAEERLRGLRLLADVKDYQAENVRIRSELADARHQQHVATVFAETQRAEYDKRGCVRMREDAERYRWIRQNPQFIGWDSDYRPDEIDRQVDAARKQ